VVGGQAGFVLRRAAQAASGRAKCLGTVSSPAALASRAAFFAREREETWPDRTPADDLIIGHVIARIETELRWHDLVLDRIGKLFGAGEAGGAGGVAGGGAARGSGVADDGAAGRGL
jgi:hypothetical protein